MTQHHPHLIIDAVERDRFSGLIEFTYDCGRLIRVKKTSIVEVGPAKATWPAPAENRPGPGPEGTQ